MAEVIDNEGDGNHRRSERQKRVRAAKRYNDVAEVLEKLKPFRLVSLTISDILFLVELAQNKEPLPGDLRKAQNILKRAQTTRTKFHKLLGNVEGLKTEQKAVAPSVPADDVEFELVPPYIDPLTMVGYPSENWRFLGTEVNPYRQMRRFKLVRVEDCDNIREVRQKLQTHGNIPEGQWQEAFRHAFPKNDGKGVIGFADPSWVMPSNQTVFPVLGGDEATWSPYFGLTIWAFNADWRWLIEV